jgi:hypothetical protein
VPSLQLRNPAEKNPRKWDGEKRQTVAISV